MDHPGSDTPTPAAPSLLDARSTGGIHAGDGFTIQDRYLALLVPGWLGDAAFTQFQAERNDDVDVWFGALRDHHQVKNEYLARGAVRTLIETFMVRNAKLIAEGRLRRYVLVCAHLSEEMRSFAISLDILRSRSFPATDGDERDATVADFRTRAETLGLGDHFDFILGHVHFEQRLSAIETGTSDLRARVAVPLMQLLGIGGLAQGIAIAEGLLHALAEDRKRAWTADELRARLAEVGRAYLEGPSRPAGDLVLVRHETLKRVAIEPDSNDAPALFQDRRVRRVSLDGVDRMAVLDVVDVQSIAHELAASGGAYLTALASPDARVLYYGFPHVPFAVLAGFLAQGHHHVSLVEHDRANGRFLWGPDAPVVPPATHSTERTVGTAAQIRLSVSATVRTEACAAVLPPDDVRLDLHVESDDIGRGVIASEAQAREYELRLRRAVDRYINGAPAITSMHVFAAVPVSVAFLVGQVLAHSGLPRCYVYNFDAAATPRYCWRLSLHDAVAGKPCVEVLGRK